MQYKKYHQITLYFEPGSKMCELTRVYFRNSGYDYSELDVNHDKVAEEKMVAISNQKRTPVVEIDERVIVGYRPDLYDMALLNKAFEDNTTENK